MAKYKIEIEGDADDAVRAYQQLTAATKRQTSATRQMGRESQQASGKTTAGMNRAGSATRKVGNEAKGTQGALRAMGSSGAAALGNMLSGMAAFTAATAVARRGVQELVAEQKRASEASRQSERGISALAQLAGGDKKRLRQLIGASEKTFSEGGARSLDEAARLTFSLESAGALGQRQLFSQLSGIVDDPAVLARAATTLQTSVGRQETGGIRAIASKAFAASKFSPASAEQLLEASARGGSAAGMLGMSDEDLLAATAIMAEATGSAERGGTQVASLLRSMLKQGGFKGRSLRQAIGQIDQMGLGDQELIKYLGREEAFSAFSILRNQVGDLGTISGKISAAEQADLAGQIVGSLEGTSAAQARRARAAENRKVLQEQQVLGASRLAAEEAAALITTDADDPNMLRRGGREVVAGAALEAGASASQLRYVDHLFNEAVEAGKFGLNISGVGIIPRMMMGGGGGNDTVPVRVVGDNLAPPQDRETGRRQGN
jgi:hypothetical protein